LRPCRLRSVLAVVIYGVPATSWNHFEYQGRMMQPLFAELHWEWKLHLLQEGEIKGGGSRVFVYRWRRSTRTAFEARDL
jgi:hypothetical protein